MLPRPLPEGVLYHTGGAVGGYVMAYANGITVYDSGDTCLFSDMQLISQMYRPQVAILPVGGKFTMGVREGARAASLIRADLVIPCHYGEALGQPADIDELARQVEILSPGTAVVPLETGQSVVYTRQLPRSARVTAAGAEPLKVLVFVGTEGIYHDHPGTGRLLRELLTAEPGVEAELSQDYEILAGGLERFHTTLFYTDVGALTPAQEAGLLAYVRGGGGFFGLHTASASFRANAGYHEMLNGTFDGHSPYMEFGVTVTDRDHPITRGLEAFTRARRVALLRPRPRPARSG